MGKPVVATTIDGYRQVMQDGVQGLLVAPRDSVGLAAALLDLLGSRELRQRYGDQGRLTARAYSWLRVSARLLRFYEEVRLGSTSPGWHVPRELPSAWLGGEEVPVAAMLGDTSAVLQIATQAPGSMVSEMAFGRDVPGSRTLGVGWSGQDDGRPAKAPWALRRRARGGSQRG